MNHMPLTTRINRQRACALCALIVASIALTIPAAGHANATTVTGTWFAADHGQGSPPTGHRSGG